MKRAACFDVPMHHDHLWQEYAKDTAPVEASRVAAIGETKSPGFGDVFLSELHHRMYAEKPEEIPVEERGSAAAVRSKLHTIAGEMAEFESLRKSTVRDPLWSGMATTLLGESIAAGMPSSDADADEAANALEAIKHLQESMPDEHKAEFDGQVAEATETAAHYQGLVDKGAQAISDTAIRSQLRKAIANAESQIESTKQALTALGWGDGMGSHGPNSPAVAVAVAKRMAGSAQLREIIRIAGRMTLTSRAKRATRTTFARSELVGVEPTRDLARILPTELSALASPLTTASLYSRLLDGSAMGYAVAGKERESKGPVIVVIDQSGSMQGAPDAWAKGVALAILDAARAERRAFGIILYDTRVMAQKLFPKPLDASPIEILQILSTAPDGGTLYGPALDAALSAIEGQFATREFKRADIVHVTDGASSTSGASEFKIRADKVGCTVFGVGIGYTGSALEAWSHSVTSITDVRSDSKAVDLIFDNV